MAIKRFLLKKFVIAVFAFVSLALVSQTVHAENLNLNFTLVNRSGMVIYRLYLSPSEMAKWDWDEDEIVGDGFPVGIGNSMNINMSNNAGRMKFRLWDMRVFFRDGKYWEFHNINLSRIRKITINVDGRGIDDLGKYYTSTKSK